MATKKRVKKTKKKAAPARKAKRLTKKASSRTKASAKKAARQKPGRKRPRGKANEAELVGYQPRGLGALTAGQSGDTQGISAGVRADSESVAELLEEGQTFEAEAIAGVENALDPDQAEVVTHQFPEDDVPEEYRERE
jgi:N utilization substance protein A